jgi:hypothetical protein
MKIIGITVLPAVADDIAKLRNLEAKGHAGIT